MEEKTHKTSKKYMHEGHRERLRDAVENDPEMDSFSEFETLEFCLSFFVPRKDTNEIAHDLIDAFGTLYGVFSATEEELFQIKNMTRAAANFLPNYLSVARRVELSRQRRLGKINIVSDAVALMKPYFLGRNHERFYMILLDVNSKVISIELISVGIANLTQVSTNAIAAKVSRTQSSKVILAHNHPGGNLDPSPEDISITENVTFMLNGLGKEVADHIIFAGNKYYSFFEHGLLNNILELTDRFYNVSRSDVVKNRRYINQYVLESKKGDDE